MSQKKQEPTTAELITKLNQSHECFTKALLDSDGQLAMLAYSNYVHGLTLALQRIMPEFMS
jgi:hypothetical protein